MNSEQGRDATDAEIQEAERVLALTPKQQRGHPTASGSDADTTEVMRPNIRQQATLYLPPPEAAQIERLRSRYNPAQHALIRAHITLCREDEVDDWMGLATRLGALGPISVSLAFGAPVRDADLVYLPVAGSTESFNDLRTALLARPGVSVRKHEPHITLIHPRNGSCSDAAFGELVSQYTPFAVTLRAVTLITQIDGGRWQDAFEWPVP